MSWRSSSAVAIDTGESSRRELTSPWLHGEHARRLGQPPEIGTATVYVVVHFRFQIESEPSWGQLLDAAHRSGAFDFLLDSEEDVWDEDERKR